MSRKMIEYEVENGNISSIDGYTVGDKITPTKIAALYPADLKRAGIDVSTKTSVKPDDVLWMDIYGRYRLTDKFIKLNTTIPAGTYRVGSVVSGNEVSTGNYKLIKARAGYTYPYSDDTVEDSKPIWIIDANPNGSGTARFVLICIRAGSYTADETINMDVYATVLQPYQ